MFREQTKIENSVTISVLLSFFTEVSVGNLFSIGKRRNWLLKIDQDALLKEEPV